MAKTNSKPGPKPGTTTKYGKRRDYHILLPLDLADRLDRASKQGGVIAYVERVLRDHFQMNEPVKPDER
jgi:hypothetical protein